MFLFNLIFLELVLVEKMIAHWAFVAREIRILEWIGTFLGYFCHCTGCYLHI